MGLRAGWLNERVALQAPTATPDGQGGETRTWTTYATVWAKVRQLAGSEPVEGQQSVPRARYEVTIRRRSDVLASHRIVRRGTLLMLVAPPNDALDDRDAVVLTCDSDGTTADGGAG